MSDGVIHAGFNHDFSKFAENCEMDRLAIETLGTALMGTERPLLVTSGLAFLAPGRVAIEEDTLSPAVAATFPRKSETLAAELAERGVNASTIRLPPSVHGDGDHGFIPIVIGMALEKGESVYAGEGKNRWPGVHRLDAAVAYRLALEKPTRGARYHVTAEEGVPFKEIAEVIGRRLNLPVVSKSPEGAAEHFGWFARFAGIDAAASSAWTRAHLGWEPKQRGLLEDIDHERYFADIDNERNFKG